MDKYISLHNNVRFALIILTWMFIDNVAVKTAFDFAHLKPKLLSPCAQPSYMEKISSSEWDHWHLLLHIPFNLKTPSTTKIRPSKMQKWRNVGAVSAASIALYCCHSGALFSATVICPQEILRIIQGKEKKLSEKSNPKCSHSLSSSGRFGSSKMQGWKGDKWQRYWSGQECLLVWYTEINLNFMVKLAHNLFNLLLMVSKYSNVFSFLCDTPERWRCLQFSKCPEKQTVSAIPSGILCIFHWDTSWQICFPFSVLRAMVSPGSGAE